MAPEDVRRCSRRVSSTAVARHPTRDTSRHATPPTPGHLKPGLSANDPLPSFSVTVRTVFSGTAIRHLSFDLKRHFHFGADRRRWPAGTFRLLSGVGPLRYERLANRKSRC